MAVAELERELERQVVALGYELVEVERAGDARRPILRLRVDRPDSTPGSGVTLDDCAHVSRALEAYLDAHPGLAPTYVLEVSSPGVERPLVRPEDFERFAGQDVAVMGRGALAGRARRLEGELLGLVDDRVRLRLAGGDEVEIPRAEITRAHLQFRWGGRQRGS